LTELYSGLYKTASFHDYFYIIVLTSFSYVCIRT